MAPALDRVEPLFSEISTYLRDDQNQRMTAVRRSVWSDILRQTRKKDYAPLIPIVRCILTILKSKDYVETRSYHNVSINEMRLCFTHRSNTKRLPFRIEIHTRRKSGEDLVSYCLIKYNLYRGERVDKVVHCFQGSSQTSIDNQLFNSLVRLLFYFGEEWDCTVHFSSRTRGQIPGVATITQNRYSIQDICQSSLCSDMPYTFRMDYRQGIPQWVKYMDRYVET